MLYIHALAIDYVYMCVCVSKSKMQNVFGTNFVDLFWSQVDTAKKQCNMQVSRLAGEVSALQMVWS